MQVMPMGRAEAAQRRNEAANVFHFAATLPAFMDNPLLTHLLRGPVSGHLFDCIAKGLDITVYTSTGQYHANVQYFGTKYDLIEFCQLWQLNNGRLGKVCAWYMDGQRVEVEMLSLLPPQDVMAWLKEKSEYGIEELRPVAWYLKDRLGLDTTAYDLAPVCLAWRAVPGFIPLTQAEQYFVASTGAVTLGMHIDTLKPVEASLVSIHSARAAWAHACDLFYNIQG